MVSLAFGKQTVLNPVLADRVKAELRHYAERPWDERPHLTSPALNGLALLSHDPRLRVDCFVPGRSHQTGMFPDIHPNATAGLFDLPNGGAVLVTDNTQLQPLEVSDTDPPRFRLLDGVFAQLSQVGTAALHFQWPLFSPTKVPPVPSGDLGRFKAALLAGPPGSSQHPQPRSELIKALLEEDPAKTPSFHQRILN